MSVCDLIWKPLRIGGCHLRALKNKTSKLSVPLKIVANKSRRCSRILAGSKTPYDGTDVWHRIRLGRCHRGSEREQRDMMKAVSEEGCALQHATDELKGDREIVMQAVSQDGHALYYASDELKGDREIVMQAVSQDGHALYYATNELKGDREIVMKAVSQNGWALQHATEKLRGEADMIEAALASSQKNSLIALKVALLSGRFCTQIFRVDLEGREDVLRASATLLGS